MMHVFGHEHGSNGVFITDKGAEAEGQNGGGNDNDNRRNRRRVVTVLAPIMDTSYCPSQSPIVIDIEG